MVDKPKWGCWLYEPKVFFFPTPSRLTPENKSAPNGLPCNLAAVNNGESNKRSRRWSKKVDQLFQEKQSTTNQATLTGLRKNSSSFICGWSERKKKEPHVLITIFRFPSSLGLNGRERIGKKEKPTSHAKASLKVTHSNFFFNVHQVGRRQPRRALDQFSTSYQKHTSKTLKYLKGRAILKASLSLDGGWKKYFQTTAAAD